MANTSSLLTGIPGVRECVVGYLGIDIAQPIAHENRAEERLAVSSIVARELGRVAELTGLGVMEVVSITGKQPAWVIAYRLKSAIVAEVDPCHSISKVEGALRKMDWLAANEWVLSDSDIEYLPPSERAPSTQAQAATRGKPPDRGNGLV